jgi:hypothetical protein
MAAMRPFQSAKHTVHAAQRGVRIRMVVEASHARDGKFAYDRDLFLSVFILGVFISTFLTNDATALILSPVVYSMVHLLNQQPHQHPGRRAFRADGA